MRKIKVMFVFGTRPEFIKMYPLMREAKSNLNMRVISCSTGQHKEMLDNLYKLFDFKPDLDFELMQPDQSLISLHADTMNCMGEVLTGLRPDWVIVQGDTTTAHAAAMAAFYLKIPVAHVEAGLRTYDVNSPFPEEMNRRAISLVARLHLCPTREAALNLDQEKTDRRSAIEITGNTGIDTLNILSDKIEKSQNLNKLLAAQFKYLNDEKYILATLHRRESFGSAQSEVLRSFLEIIKSRDINIVFPVHPNPKVQAAVNNLYKDEFGRKVFWINEHVPAKKVNKAGRLFLVPPLDYPSLVYAMKKCEFVLTDSGGLQEEAPSFGKKILILRESTERPEGIAAGFSQLVGTKFQDIVSESCKLIDGVNRWNKEIPKNPYGDGRASEKIMNILQRSYAERTYQL